MEELRLNSFSGNPTYSMHTFFFHLNDWTTKNLFAPPLEWIQVTTHSIRNISIRFQAKENYRGVFEIQKSGDKISSGEIGLDIRTHASPKVGQDQVSGGVSVLCWHAANMRKKITISIDTLPVQPRDSPNIFPLRSLLAECLYSNGNKWHPSSSTHLSQLIRS